MEWQPIETAPKDGTRILIYFPASCVRCRGIRVEESVFIGHWHQPGNPQQIGFWTGWGSSRRTATHWMPLPKSPTDEEL